MKTSEALRLILKSRNSSLSRISICCKADSIIASELGSLYFRSKALLSEPALTPMRMGMPLSRELLTTARTLSSLPIFPGFMRRQSTPYSSTFSAMR